MASPLRALPLAALLLGACLSDRRDWGFVQAIGGMAVGTPYRSPAGVVLPIRIDVSGTRAITTRPTTVNSGLAVETITVTQQGREVRLGLITTLAGGGSSPLAKDVLLGRLEAGRYTVRFAQPDGGTVDLGEIVVPP